MMSALRRVFFYCTLSIATLVALEGTASLGIMLYEVVTLQRPLMSEKIHTEYDPLLGWVNKPHVRIENIYGAETVLTTNAQRFRAQRDTPQYKVGFQKRIICSGDSFTLGYGVSDDESWCQLLEKPSQQETVNMGQGGYGLDQIYLWYQRDGMQLEHDAHLVAITLQDIVRMAAREFLGYPKPFLRLEGGRLVHDDAPLPQASLVARMKMTASRSARGLRLFHLLGGTEHSLHMAPPPYSLASARELKIAEVIVEKLRSFHAERGSKFAVVLIPLLSDLRDPSALVLERELSSMLAKMNIPYLNAIEHLRLQTGSFTKMLYIPEGAVDYPGAAGHLSAAGNKWLADLLVPFVEQLR